MLVAINQLNVRSGSIPAASFTGNPKTASVSFGTPMPSTSYNVTVTGTDGRSWVVPLSSMTTTGFIINSQANQSLTGPVYWHAILTGEAY